MTQRRAALAVLAVSVTLSAAARAQQPRPPRDTAGVDTSFARLPVFEVRASIAPVAGPVVASGVPARISVISGSDIEAWEPRTLADVLASQAGVSIYDDLGTPYKLNLSMRGFNAGPTVGLPSGMTVFLDGVRQNEPDAQQVNFDLLPMEHVERVELLSGSASLLGPNSLAGAVNLVTRRGRGPAGGTPAAELEVSTASFGAYSVGGSASGVTGRGLDYYGSAGYERERGWRTATGASNYNGFVNLGRSSVERGLSLQFYGARSRAETAGSLPESIFDVAPRTNFTAGDFEDLDATQIAVSAFAPGARGRASVTGYARRSGAERFNVNQAPDPNVRSRTTAGTIGAAVDWRRAVGTGAGGFAVRVGLDGAANRVRVRLYEEPIDAGTPPELTTDVESPSVDLAGYGLADYQLGRITLSAGARYDYIRIPFRNRLDPTEDTTSVYTRLSPRAGATVDVGSGVSLYASAGESFRAPAILELGCADPEASCPLPFALGDDPPLDPVRATTYEVGARWAAGAGAVSASAYRADVRDEIFFVASEAARLAGYFTNIDRTRREGLELSAQLSLSGRLVAYANYAHTRATFRTPAELFSIRAEDDFVGSALAGPNDVESGDRLSLVPDHQAKAGVLAGWPAGLGLGFDARFIGRQWLRGDEANETRPLDPYFTANARLAWARRGWEIALVVTNLLDSRDAIFGAFNENRQTGDLERFLTPMQARTFKLAVRRHLGSAPPSTSGQR